MAIQNFIDFLSAPSSVSSTQFKIINQEILDTAISRNRGTILVTGHFGLWENGAPGLGPTATQLLVFFKDSPTRGQTNFLKNIENLTEWVIFIEEILSKIV